MPIHVITVPAPIRLIEDETGLPAIKLKPLEIGQGKAILVPIEPTVLQDPINFRMVHMRIINGAKEFMASIDAVGKALEIRKKLLDCPCMGGEKIEISSDELTMWSDVIKAQPTLSGYQSASILAQIMPHFQAVLQAPPKD